MPFTWEQAFAHAEKAVPADCERVGVPVALTHPDDIETNIAMLRVGRRNYERRRGVTVTRRGSK